MLKVMTLYPLLGGFIGGLLLLPIVMIFYQYPAEHGLFFIYISSLLGIVPALLSAIVIDTLRITIKNHRDYHKVFIIGFICTFLSALIFMGAIIGGFFVNLKEIIGIVLMGLSGGISSVILAKFILPKY